MESKFAIYYHDITKYQPTLENSRQIEDKNSPHFKENLEQLLNKNSGDFKWGENVNTANLSLERR